MSKIGRFFAKLDARLARADEAYKLAAAESGARPLTDLDAFVMVLQLLETARKEGVTLLEYMFYQFSLQKMIDDGRHPLLREGPKALFPRAQL